MIFMSKRAFGAFRAGWLVGWLGLLLFGAVAASGAEPSMRERLTDEISRGLTVTRGVERDSVFRSLRSLRDESLRPYFSRLVTGSDDALRRHGVMALGELSADGSVSPTVLVQIENRSLRASIVGEALGAGLLGEEQIRGVLSWPDLEPSLEMLLRARLVRMGSDADRERLGVLAESSDGATAAYARLVLTSLGVRERAGTAWEALDGLPGLVQWSSAGVLLGRISDEQLQGCGAFVDSVLASLPDAPESVDRSSVERLAVRAMLTTAPSRGERLWRERYSGAESLGGALQWSVIGAAAWATAPMGVLETMAADERDAIARLGRASLAFRSGDDGRIVEELVSVLSTRSTLLRGWAFEVVDRLERERRASVLELVTLRMLGESRVSSEVVFALSRELARIAPGRLSSVVRGAVDGGSEALTEAVLAGALQGPPAVLWGADEEPEWGVRALSHMGAIAAARWGDSSDGVRERVERAAMGESMLPRPLRVQAAWLALRIRGEHRQALATLMASR